MKDQERRFECQNCGKVYNGPDDFWPFEASRDLCSRLSPGERVPDGECRECQAFVHEVGQPRVVIAVRGGVAYVEEAPDGVNVVIEDYDNLEEEEAE